MFRSISSCQGADLDLRAAVDKGAEAWSSAKQRLVPLAADAKDKLIPLALDAKGRVVPLAAQAREKLAPLAVDARDRIVPLVAEAAAQARPAVAGVAAKVADVVDTEVRPRVALLVEEAQADPRVEAAAKRGRAVAAALKGDLLAPQDQAVVVQPAKRHPVLKALALGALLGAAAWLARTLLTRKGDGWELPSDEEFTATPAPDATPAPAGEAAPAAEAPAPDAAKRGEKDDLGDPFRYGEGSFIGTQPPEGYTIKGNERTMTYHVPGALAYERCSTVAWFNSPEAAERNGFTRAKR